MGLFDNFPYTNFHELNIDAIIKILREMQDEWEATKTEWADMKAFINNYFDNLDVSDEIAAKLDKMAKDGSLYDIIQPDIASTVTAWLNEHISGQTPPVDSSLRVSGAAADALVTGNNLRALEACNAIDLVQQWVKNDKDQNGINFHWLADGSCRITGTSSAAAFVNIWADLNALPDTIQPGQRLYIKLSGNVAVFVPFYFYRNGVFFTGPDLRASRNLTVPDEATGLLIRFQVSANTTVNEIVTLKIYDDVTEKDINASDITKRKGVDDIEVLTDYGIVDGFITANNNVLQSGRRTTMMPVYPNKDYYVPYLYEDNFDTIGAMYDRDKQFIDVIRRDSQSEVVDGIMRKFRTSAECHYFVLNVSTQYYSASLCSRPFIFPGRQELNPVYPPQISVPKLGNFTIAADDKARQIRKNRKLCCIGDSLTAINRLKQEGVNLGNRMFGWQEYVGLLYDSVTSYGFSGGTWGPAAGYEQYQNIYDGIVTAGVDLSGYDEFILFAGYNAMGERSYPMGDLGTYNENTSPTTTMLGAMRGVIDYIMTQNPEAKIYIMTNPHTGSYYSYTATRERLAFYRSEILRIAPILGIEIIDAEVNAGFTKALYDTRTITYDDIHPNDKGMSMIGLCALSTIMSK